MRGLRAHDIEHGGPDVRIAQVVATVHHLRHDHELRASFEGRGHGRSAQHRVLVVQPGANHLRAGGVADISPPMVKENEGVPGHTRAIVAERSTLIGLR
jgi:hypothetical protein